MRRVFVSRHSSTRSNYQPCLAHFYDYRYGGTCGGMYDQPRDVEEWLQAWLMSEWTECLYMPTNCYPPQLQKYFVPTPDQGAHYASYRRMHNNGSFEFALSEDFSQLDPEELCTWDWVPYDTSLHGF